MKTKRSAIALLGLVVSSAEARRFRSCSLRGLPLVELAINIETGDVIRTLENTVLPGNRARRGQEQIESASFEGKSQAVTTSAVTNAGENSTEWLKFYGRECRCADLTAGEVYCAMENNECWVPWCECNNCIA